MTQCLILAVLPVLFACSAERRVNQPASAVGAPAIAHSASTPSDAARDPAFADRTMGGPRRAATAEEIEPFVGRWVGDIEAAIARGIREPMQGGRFPRDWSDTIGYVGPMILEVRSDGTWIGGLNHNAQSGIVCVREGRVLLVTGEHPDDWMEMPIAREDGSGGKESVLTGAFGPVPHKRAARGPAVTAAELQGRWRPDPDATLALQVARVKSAGTLPPKAEPLLPLSAEDEAAARAEIAGLGYRVVIKGETLSTEEPLPPGRTRLWKEMRNAQMHIDGDLVWVASALFEGEAGQVLLLRVIDGKLLLDSGDPIVLSREP